MNTETEITTEAERLRVQNVELTRQVADYQLFLQDAEAFLKLELAQHPMGLGQEASAKILSVLTHDILGINHGVKSFIPQTTGYAKVWMERAIKERQARPQLPE